jgi:hypothetical protein
MNARPIAAANLKTPVSPRFDAKFIEEHKLIEKYLENKLPFKGARDLENWCRSHPEYLNDLKLSERAQASLKLLEASGKPQDLREPPQPWWKTPYVLIGMGVVTLLSLAAFWTLMGKYSLLRGELEDTRAHINQGSLVQPAGSRAGHQPCAYRGKPRRSPAHGSAYRFELRQNDAISHDRRQAGPGARLDSQ